MKQKFDGGDWEKQEWNQLSQNMLRDLSAVTGIFKFSSLNISVKLFSQLSLLLKSELLDLYEVSYHNVFANPSP